MIDAVQDGPGAAPSRKPGLVSMGHAQRFWLRNKRRLAETRGIMDRRRFKALRQRFYETLWQEAAACVGATTKAGPSGLTEIRRGDSVTFVRHADLMLDSEITIRLMANKALSYGWLAAKGYRVTPHVAFTLKSINRADAFLATQNGPVVVKPADGTGGGRGITTGITSRSAMEAAARNAAGFHSDLLIETQLTGSSFRLLYFEGAFLDAVRRDSPQLTGDGKSTVRQLIEAETADRLEGRPIRALSPLVIDQECRNTLKSQGLTPAYTPHAGETLRIKLAVNENGARQNRIVRHDIHRDIIDAGARIVGELGVRFAGLDVTASDLSLPLSQTDAIFNEVNVNPGIHHHYLVANPEQSASVAPTILERMFESGAGTLRL